jgi:hypothetical protein
VSSGVFVRRTSGGSTPAILRPKQTCVFQPRFAHVGEIVDKKLFLQDWAAAFAGIGKLVDQVSIV